MEYTRTKLADERTNGQLQPSILSERTILERPKSFIEIVEIVEAGLACLGMN